MKALRTFWLHLRSLTQRGAVKQEIDDELRFHIEQRTAENIAAGMSPEEAAREARRRFGNLQSVREECRARRGASFGEATWQDVRLGLRMLSKKPGFTGAAVVTLALGIGITTVVLSIIRDVILAPPPYPNADRIVLVAPIRPDGQPHSRAWSSGHWKTLKGQAKSFDALGCYEWAFDFLLMPDGSESIKGMTVSADYFQIVGQRPFLGRTFSEEELKPKSKETVIILGHDLWQRRFNSDPNIIGKSVSLGRWPALTVIGIMPPRLRFLPSPQNERDPSYDLHARVDYLLPAAPDAGKPGEGSYHVIGRLRASSSRAEALAEVAALLPRISQAASDFEGVQASVQSLTQVVNADGDRLRVPLLASVVLVFLITCGNVSGLLLVRGLQRQREYAVRSVLGARPMAILRGVLTESFLLAGLGGVFGVVIAASLVILLGKSGGHGLPPMDGLAFGWSVAGIAFGVSLLAALLAGLLPALRAMQRPVADVLAGTARGSVGRGERWLLRGTAVLQASLTLALLIGAGLLVRTAWNLASVRPGYQTGNILTMSVTLVKGNWFDFHVRALERVATIPGVKNVAFAWGLPLTGNAWMGAVEAADEPAKPLKDREIISIRAVTPDYFGTMGMTVLTGRGVRTTDAGNAAEDIPGNAPFVAVINQRLAAACFAGRDPLGKKLRLSWRPEEPEIVGVVGDTRTDALTKPAGSELYFSMWQAPAWVKHLVVRTEADPRRLAASVQKELRALDPTVAIEDVQTLDRIRTESVAPQTFAMWLLIGFSLVGSVLAIVGIYGVLSLSVGSRRREIAIRMAVGAQRRNVLGLVLSEGLKLIAVGLAMGAGLAIALAQVLRAFLFGVEPADSFTFAMVVMLFTAIALLACFIPARRATRVDPMEALRYE